MKRARRHVAGFTLLELLVVLGIVAVVLGTMIVARPISRVMVEFCARISRCSASKDRSRCRTSCKLTSFSATLALRGPFGIPLFAKALSSASCAAKRSSRSGRNCAMEPDRLGRCAVTSRSAAIEQLREFTAGGPAIASRVISVSI